MQVAESGTIIVAILVLFLGKFLTSKVSFLRNFNIPEPVSGGLIASLLFGLIYIAFDIEFVFALHLRDSLLIIFFTTIGLSSRVEVLLQGGKPMFILLVLAVTYLFIQNLTGIGIIHFTDLPAEVGVLGGSVSLSGGHGTAIAWAEEFANSYGVQNAMEIGIACATFGLVLGGLIGGPLAQFLITRNKLETSHEERLTVGKPFEVRQAPIDYQRALNSILAISVSIALGLWLNRGLDAINFHLPQFVTCLFAGIVVINVGPLIIRHVQWPRKSRSLALISDLSLGLFLAMSLMSLKLWTLADAGPTIFILLIAQVTAVCLFVVFVVFPAMGRDYDAAVMSAGYAGLAMGATPTAIANMTAVTQKFGNSAKAFIVVPLIGAFFIDLANSLVIQSLLNWLQ